MDARKVDTDAVKKRIMESRRVNRDAVVNDVIADNHSDERVASEIRRLQVFLTSKYRTSFKQVADINIIMFMQDLDETLRSETLRIELAKQQMAEKLRSAKLNDLKKISEETESELAGYSVIYLYNHTQAKSVHITTKY